MTDLTERQAAFIDNFVELNDAAAAYEKAGYRRFEGLLPLQIGRAHV